jgi:hypothetical protein
LATSFSDELQLIVQWRCSENEELLMDLVHGNVRDLEWNPGGSFESKGRLVLFDAASPLRELSNVDYLEFVWPEGVGVVRAAEISVGDSAARVVGFSLGESL